MILGNDTFLCMTMIYEVNKLLFHFVRPSVGMMDVFVEEVKVEHTTTDFYKSSKWGQICSTNGRTGGGQSGDGVKKTFLSPALQPKESMS